MFFACSGSTIGLKRTMSYAYHRITSYDFEAKDWAGLRVACFLVKSRASFSLLLCRTTAVIFCVDQYVCAGMRTSVRASPDMGEA
jgi:hypothetical protein